MNSCIKHKILLLTILFLFKPLHSPQEPAEMWKLFHDIFQERFKDRKWLKG